MVPLNSWPIVMGMLSLVTGCGEVGEKLEYLRRQSRADWMISAKAGRDLLRASHELVQVLQPYQNISEHRNEESLVSNDIPSRRYQRTPARPSLDLRRKLGARHHPQSVHLQTLS